MKYRLALDIGSQSIGWAVARLNHEAPPKPVALIKAGARIFGDGRNPKDGSSLAVTRREARAMRRRRDRLLKRKARMLCLLVQYGFFPQDEGERKVLERLDPYYLRTKGLDGALTPAEFARALFHINQRRGFKSNRKTDKQDNESGALKTAINTLRQSLKSENCRTVGEWLYKRHKDGKPVRARYRENRVVTDDGKPRIEKSYDLYIDRAMIEQEFDALWRKQAELNPILFTDQARDDLKGCLLFQRNLRPVQAGRCTFLPDEVRAPLALPSQQRFRIYQEVNHLRVLEDGLREGPPLTLQQRDALVQALETGNKSFESAIPRLLGMPGTVQFNLADTKRRELKGNATSMALSKPQYFGKAWHTLTLAKQDAIVMRLLTEEDESALLRWLMEETGVDEAHAEAIANVRLPEGYGRLSAKALALILPELQREVQTYDKAVKAAGFHHSQLNGTEEIPGRTFSAQRLDLETGEIKTFHVFKELPYYGECLQRHVGFADPAATSDDPPEKQFGRIANPTVHIGLNQVRVVVSALIKQYGHPAEVVVELARELKQSREQKREEQERQAKNQRRNEKLRAEAAEILQIPPERVRHADIQKLILWEELNGNPAERCCPYSGKPINKTTLLSAQVEVDHILPFSKTLDDSLNNKVVAFRQANRVKGNRTPWEARHDFAAQGWGFEEIESRAKLMPDKNKRYRFGEDAMQRWDKDGKGFLARALSDTRYLSRVAKEYLSLICPQATRVIPGQMTAKLRHHFGLNGILGLTGEKNRNDHRHHAVDACVIVVTDQGLLQRFADANKQTQDDGLSRLVQNMPDPWPTYREHVKRAIQHIWVSHKPDHGYEGAMMEDTSYGIRKDGSIKQRTGADGEKGREVKNVIRIAEPGQPQRHGVDASGKPLPYKGYIGGSNYCLEIIRNEKGRWEGEVISTYEAYQIVREHGSQRLQYPTLSASGRSLVMRLMKDDCVRMEVDGRLRTVRVIKIASSGQVFMIEHQEANVDARYRNKEIKYLSKMPGSFQTAKARRVTISPIGMLRDPGFKD